MICYQVSYRLSLKLAESLGAFISVWARGHLSRGWRPHVVIIVSEIDAKGFWGTFTSLAAVLLKELVGEEILLAHDEFIAVLVERGNYPDADWSEEV